MNRPKRNEHNRETILQKGMELFNRRGYHGTGIKEILDACQVPKGSFYNYFESKEQFGVEVLNYHHAQEIAKWRDHFATTEGRRLQQIRVMIDSFVDDYRQDPNLCGCLLTNLMGEVGNLSDSFRKVVQTSSDEVISFMTEDLIIAQSEGDVRTDIPVEAMAKIFWDSWQGALLRTKVGGSTQPLHETVDTLFSLFKAPEGASQENNA
ncbi:TetR/AcrR family transcriptional regulator [Aliamphritea spongicola]|uniref:TetR/AcrR family transcriptional regulator n=1 Tax=Aliamphritea spongicola TaxID=707589 RepID=UPI00196B040D|nr:TetR/AcrR family transcriptional regulator [Aliamphritea spongicola]MBN3561719.1 TetR/AcrR family transcriptional regulator [Aliamphritea spongicola]